MDLNLTGKTVVVTGGASNIGRAISLAFVREGANLVVADVDEKQAQQVIDEAATLGGASDAVSIKTDVTDWGAAEAMAAAAVEKFGRIDVLVNNVGWVEDALFVDKAREKCQKEIDLNLWSVINCTKAVARHMIEQKCGKIVNIGSDAGRVGQYREPIYAGCKAAVMGLSKTLARELGRYGINVNVVCPGITLPDKASDAGELSMTAGRLTQENVPADWKEKLLSTYALKRLCTAEDIANAVVFLASDASSFITGQTLSVDGGYVMI